MVAGLCLCVVELSFHQQWGRAGYKPAAQWEWHQPQEMQQLSHLHVFLVSPLLSRNWLCFHSDCVPSECVLHRDPGLGTLLPVPVVPERAAMGTLPPEVEHAHLCGRHSQEEQNALDITECH